METYLSLVEGVVEGDSVNLAVLVLELSGERGALLEVLEAEDRDLVGRLDLVVVGSVGEREGEHTLLLEVGLVDSGERSGDDGDTSEESGLEGGVLSRGPLSVVGVTDDDPGDAVLSVPGTDGRDRSPLSSDLVLDLVGLAVGVVLSEWKEGRSVRGLVVGGEAGRKESKANRDDKTPPPTPPSQKKEVDLRWLQ